MRVSNSQFFSQTFNAITDVQNRIGKYSQQVSTGKRVLQPADDPLAAANILAIRERVTALDQFARNSDSAEAHMSQQEVVLGGVANELQRIRELVVQGHSTVLSDVERRFISAEIRERATELVSLANTRNDGGEYIFSGTATKTLPFTSDPAGGVVYNGDQTVREIQIGESRQIGEGVSGYEAFMAIRNGNGTFATGTNAANTGTGRIIPGTVVDPTVYEAHDFRIVFTTATTFDVIDDTAGATILAAQTYVDGGAVVFNGVANAISGTPAAGDEFSVTASRYQSVFETVDNVIQMLETPLNDASTGARFQAEMDRAFEDIDQAINQTLELRATIGARQNTLDTQRAFNADLKGQLENAHSKLEDVDMIQAISLLARETNALEAAQAAFVRVQGLSLFNFL